MTLGDHIAADGVHLGAQKLKALDMLVDGTGAEIAAAGHGHLGLAEPTQQRPEKIVRGANLPGHLMGHGGGVDAGGVDLHGTAAQAPHLGTHGLQDVQDQDHIGNIRNILNPASALHQNGGWQNGNGSVFRPADGYMSIQRLASMNHVLRHGLHLLW